MHDERPPKGSRGKKGRRRPPSDPRHPACWPTWAGLGLLRLLTLLPVPALGRLGDGLGLLLWALAPGRRHIVRTNLQLAFADRTRAERRRLERAHFRSAARGVLEGALAWWAPIERLTPHYTVEGVEHLETAREAGRGVILLLPHHTTIEIGGRIISHHVPDFHPSYKPTKDAAFNAAMVRGRSDSVAGLLRSDDMRAILRALRSGGVISYSPDQDFGRQGTVFAPFMGVPTSTLTMTARLARTSGAPIVPLHCRRLPGNRWHVRLEPALRDFPSGDDAADAARINRVIEEQVAQAPEQHLWLHRRFKTRPEPGAPSPYRKAGRWASGREAPGSGG